MQVAMLSEYVARALVRAAYDRLADGTYAAEVDGLPGVLATGTTVETCRARLTEVVEEWVLVRVARGLDVPELDGVRVAVTPTG